MRLKNIFLQFLDKYREENNHPSKKKKRNKHLAKIIIFSHYRSKKNPSIRINDIRTCSKSVSNIVSIDDVLTRIPPSFFSFSRIPFSPGWARLRQQISSIHRILLLSLHAKFMRANVRTFGRTCPDGAKISLIDDAYETPGLRQEINRPIAAGARLLFLFREISTELVQKHVNTYTHRGKQRF